MLSRFFIDRPIFAAVCSILITLAGVVAVFTLPLAQFPSITPPTVQVSCSYPGASAKEVADSVAAPIEQQVNGVEGIMYMSSQCANDGSYNLTVTFQQGVNLDMAQVLVQNRVNLAVPLLPEVIRATGVATLKRSPDILMGLAISSPDQRYDQLFLSNFSLMQIKDELARIPGVGDVFLFGQRDYSMRIWVDPAKMAARGLSASDVVRAIREQNTQVAAGSIGQEPIEDQQLSQITLSTLGRLSDVEEFENIIVKTGAQGRLVRIKDIGRVELGAKNEYTRVRLDGQDTVFLAIFQTPDANALDLRGQILRKMEELKASFPEGVAYDIGFDTTPYTRESIDEVFKTLGEAIVLVAIVVLLFLQNWRSALIPLVAVPVAIVGTFAAMALIGFSLNNLTLFGLVLAIGIVVDDAIVVVEAVEHHIEQGLEPRAATIAAMDQVSGPVIAVGLVLSAVFLPCAFIGGITGQFFRQFALTIAVSTMISTFNSLSLSPALTALLLKRHEKHAAPPLPILGFPLIGAALGYWLGPTLWSGAIPGVDPDSWVGPALMALVGAIVLGIVGRPLNRLLGAFFRGFNTFFNRATRGYVSLVQGMLRLCVVVLLIYGGLVGLTWWEFNRIPRGFIPQQDMGFLMVNVQLPDSASLDRTDEVMRKIEMIAAPIPGVKHVAAIGGQSFVLSAAGSNFGSMFIGLKDYKERREPERSSEAIANQLRMRFAAEIPDAQVAVFGPPAVRGAGRAGGFAVMIEDREDAGPAALQREIDNLVRHGATTPGLLMLFSVFRANVPQLHIDPDAGACMMRGVSLSDFSDTLAAFEGSVYCNDFNLFGRTWQVVVQAEPEFRSQPEDLPQLRVRNSRGAMVPIGSLASQREVNGPLILSRYNMYPAASINGQAAPGVSSGQAIHLVEQLARRELSRSMAFEWTDMSYLEQVAGTTAMQIFACSIAMVFLMLAAQYESWSLPLAVILVVPMCLLSALTGVEIAHMDMNIFTQVGFVVLVGLASKNAILIVEFAKQQRLAGKPRDVATLEACHLRLRPIVMTSLAFILGVVPLIFAHGAGAEMRKTLGTAVFSGMLGVTLFGVVLTPVFFYSIDSLGDLRLFRSRPVQIVGGFLLDLLRLGFVFRPLHAVARRLGGTVLSRSAPRGPQIEAPEPEFPQSEPQPPAAVVDHE
ncbi:MAG: multidrug efflux RND transporter permease subunit [Planctomycetes bacterium]|nr:multidrug efflux RND transporter permease subunit [Planctomycetota bacterium]